MEKFCRETLKNSNLPTNLNFFFVYKYKGMKYSNFKCNKHGRLNKLYVNSEENFKTKYLTRCLETRNFSNLLVFFISEYFGMNYSKLNIWIKYTGK